MGEGSVSDFSEKFLGRYLKLIGIRKFRLPQWRVPYSLVVVLGAMVVMGLNFFSDPFSQEKLNLGYSPTLKNQFFEASKKAAQLNDFKMAERLFEMGNELTNDNGVVKGVESEVYDQIHPEEKLYERLEELDDLIRLQPSFRDALVEKALILYQLREDEEMRKVFAILYKLDPNDEGVKVLGELIKSLE